VSGERIADRQGFARAFIDPIPIDRGLFHTGQIGVANGLEVSRPSN
jgi:hypothetical protein